MKGKSLKFWMSFFVGMFMCSNITTLAAPSSNLEMDDLDVIIASHYFLKSKDEENFWTNSLENAEVVPLYDTKQNITSYYVEFDNGGYAVVNNNIENPTVIEFGDGNNPLIRNILNQNTYPHIIYNNPLSIYDGNSIATMKNEENQMDIYKNYPDLLEPNMELANMLSEQKNIIKNQNSIMPYGDGNYGFINLDEMPSGSYSSDNIPYSGTSWVITSDFSDIAKNHCGATAVTNLAMYFANQNYSDLKKDSDRETFIAVHKIVGDGPVMTIAGKAKEYFSNCGYTLKYRSVGTFDGIKAATGNDRPCGILLADGIVEWHWILSVGYRQYSSGDNYMRVMDGWNRNVNRFYKLHSGSLWISATEYWM